MELIGVRIEQPANTPILLLREAEGRQRLLPIYIGGPEAAAIAYALEGEVPPRPLTHDLFCTVLGELATQVERIVITAFEVHTYFAELHLVTDGVTKVVSSRPSDAVALAVRLHAPIFASEAVLDEMGRDPEPANGSDEIIEEFRAFIEDVNPEDFGGG